MKILARSLFVLGVACLLLGFIAGIGNRQVLDGGRFAGHVDSIRADPQVSRQVGLVITDEIIDQQPDLVALRPLLESASATVVASPALGPVVRAAVAPLHNALTTGDNDQVILRLVDVGALVVAAITTLSPEAQAVIPENLDVTLASIGGQEFASEFIEIAHRVSILSWLLPVIGLSFLIVAGLLRRFGWRGVGRTVGRGVVTSSGLLIFLLIIGGFVASRFDAQTLGGAFGQAAWRELENASWPVAAIVAAIGVLLILSCRISVDFASGSLLSRTWRWFSQPQEEPQAEVVRALGILGLGVLTLLRPLTVVTFIAGIVGFLLILDAARALLRVALKTLPRLQRLSKPRLAPVPMVFWSAVLLIALSFSAFGSSKELPTRVNVLSTGKTCNGYEELCDRPYNEVAFPATHNSMSAADQPGWFLAEQPYGIMRQLDDGISVLLIDTWFGQKTQRPGMIATSASSRKEAIAEAERAYGRTVLESALRVRDALQLTPIGSERPYLCHALCELGSTDWEPLMKDVRHWLDANPREVITFFIQDQVPPSDTAALVERAGLLPYVHTPEPGKDWPTLGDMIDSGKRVVFLMENSSGGAEHPWLIDSRVEVQDTPYAFRNAADFSCELFRGREEAPLFLINHWLSNFDTRVTDAKRVNSAKVLLNRVRKCQDERGRLPNFVAVDHYDQGDLFAVVNALNDVS